MEPWPKKTLLILKSRFACTLETLPMTEQIFAVGGAIRDALLGLPVKDRDWVVVGSTPERMDQEE